MANDFKVGDIVKCVNAGGRVDRDGNVCGEKWGSTWLTEGAESEVLWSDKDLIEIRSKKRGASCKAHSDRFVLVKSGDVERTKLERRCVLALFKKLIRERRKEIESLRKELGRA